MTVKIFSFYERLEERKRKDGADIGFTPVHYDEVGDNRSRLAQRPDADIMERVGGDLLRTDVELLGCDMARLAGAETREEINRHLTAEISSHSKCSLA